MSCLLVHGWGMNHSVWQPVLDKLPDWLDARALDLPGHGQRPDASFTDLWSLSEDLQAQCAAFKQQNRPLILLGWSLGALPCLQIAIDKLAQVDGLLLVSSSPCFVTRPGWTAGVDGEIFNRFAQSLNADFSGTIRRFLSLQVRGPESGSASGPASGPASGRAILRDLRARVLAQPRPSQACLDAGLAILQQVDLRSQLADIPLPVSWALGAQDGLVSIELAAALTTLMPQADVRQYASAGHAPFLSHTDAFVQQLVEFAQLVMVRYGSK